MSRVSRNSRIKQAFTLIEMLLVVVIIGILAGVVTNSLAGKSQEAKITRAQADLAGHLGLALDLFEQDAGRYPTTEEGLESLVTDPGVPGWKGPYLKSGLKPDPWGTAYIYAIDADNPRMYKLSSAGPDLQPSTEDDILP